MTAAARWSEQNYKRIMKTLIYVATILLLMSCQKESIEKTSKTETKWLFSGNAKYTITETDSTIHLIASKMIGACYLYTPNSINGVANKYYRLSAKVSYSVDGSIIVRPCLLDADPKFTHKEQIFNTITTVFDEQILMTFNANSVGFKLDVWTDNSSIDLIVKYITLK